VLLGPGIPDDRIGTLGSGNAGLTEATSNLNVGGTVCARTVTPSSKPIAMGVATENNPAAASSAFVPPFRFFTILSFSIASILILKTALLRLSENNSACAAEDAGTGDYSPHDMALLTCRDGPDRESVES
jgi:hypothetical protein